jgi:hypothetical protein
MSARHDRDNVPVQEDTETTAVEAPRLRLKSVVWDGSRFTYTWEISGT